MSRFLLLLFLTTSLVFSCGEEDQADIDRDLILGYIDNNNLQAEEDPSGLFYTIDTPGGEEKPQLTDSVEISYRGTLLSGLQFDASPADTTVTFLLDDLIPVWEIGIPKYGRGGAGTLLIHSALGYGRQRVGPIPAYSVLIFDIEVIDF